MHNSGQEQGAGSHLINRLPEREIDEQFLARKHKMNEDLTKCMICHCDYELKEKLRTMPCSNTLF